MIISEKKHYNIFNFLLILISICLPFGKLSNLAIILFILFNIAFLKKNNYSSSGIKLSLLILIPLLLEILFFFNNDSLLKGLKSTEKYISIFFIALFIIGQYKSVNVKRIIKWYSIGMVIILFFLEIRFVILYPELISKYVNGIDLWEAGYAFTNSFNVHAPAINLHLAFVFCVGIYLTCLDITNKANLKSIILDISISVIALVHILIINTRMALICAIICMFFIIIYELLNKVNKKQAIMMIGSTTIILTLVIIITVRANPFMIEKYTSYTFKNLDKIGKIDEIENPEAEAYNGLVLRLSIWKSAIELASKSPIIGVGASDANPKLFEYYKESNQHFLSKYEFPVHNQYINFFLKFGIIGVFAIIVYMIGILIIGIKCRNSLIIAFFILFSISNFTDDFLNRFDGIGFSAFFYSIFIVYYLQLNQDKPLSID